MKLRLYKIKVLFGILPCMPFACKQIDTENRRSTPKPEAPSVETGKYGKLQHSKFALHDLTQALNEFALTELPITWKKYLSTETFNRIDAHLKNNNGTFPLLFHAQGRINGDCQELNKKALDLNWGTENQDINKMLTDIIPRAAFGLPLPTYGTITGLDKPEFSEENIFLEEEVSCAQIHCLQQEYSSLQCGEYNPITHNSNTSYVKALRNCSLRVPAELKQYEQFIGSEKAVIASSMDVICQK